MRGVVREGRTRIESIVGNRRVRMGNSSARLEFKKAAGITTL